MLMQEIKDVIKTVATRGQGNKNTLVMLRTDLLPVDADLFADDTDVATVSIKDRNANADGLFSQYKKQLNRLEKSLVKLNGDVSEGMKVLLANVLSKSEECKIVFVENIDYHLNMSEMKMVIEFLQSKFKETIFIFTATNDIVFDENSKCRYNILFVFDKDWLLYDSSELTNPAFVRGVKEDDETDLAVLLNHSMNDLWQSHDEERYLAIDKTKLTNARKIIYDLIKAPF